jgi:spore germination cell wall hydrolase CwlJ-like protein
MPDPEPHPFAIDPNVLAALCIFAEARNQPFNGQIAVGNVLRNRMRRRYSSDGTVAGTVFRAWQFSWTNTDDPQRTRVMRCYADEPAYVEALRAWAISESHDEVSPMVVLYHTEHPPNPNTPGPPRWAHRATREVQIGDHVFYAD